MVFCSLRESEIILNLNYLYSYMEQWRSSLDVPYLCLRPFFFFFKTRLTDFKSYLQSLLVFTERSSEHDGIVER